MTFLVAGYEASQQSVHAPTAAVLFFLCAFFIVGPLLAFMAPTPKVSGARRNRQECEELPLPSASLLSPSQKKKKTKRPVAVPSKYNEEVDGPKLSDHEINACDTSGSNATPEQWLDGHFRMKKPPRSRSTKDQPQSNAAPPT